ncbi:hypothetical protein IC582_027330 [Cucumis melo]
MSSHEPVFLHSCGKEKPHGRKFRMKCLCDCCQNKLSMAVIGIDIAKEAIDMALTQIFGSIEPVGSENTDLKLSGRASLGGI